MVLRRGKLALLGIVALILFCSGAGLASMSLGSLTVTVLLLAVLLGLYVVTSLRYYLRYERFMILSKSRQLFRLMTQRLQRGEVAIINGKLYYRSRAKNNGHTPWSRLWIAKYDRAYALENVGDSVDVDADVLWPGPFRGGIRYNYDQQPYMELVSKQLKHGSRLYKFVPSPLPMRLWLHLWGKNDDELRKLSQTLTTAINDLTSLSRSSPRYVNTSLRLPLRRNNHNH